MPTAALLPLVTRSRTTHVPTAMPNRGHYAWSKYRGGDCVGSVAIRDDRAVLGEVSGNARRRARAFQSRAPRLKRTKFSYKACGLHLYIKEGYFAKFHARLHSN